MSIKHTSRAAQLAEDEMWWGGSDRQEEAQPQRQKRPSPRAQALPPMVKSRPGAGSRLRRRREQTLSRVLMYMTLGVLALCLFLQVNRYAAISANTKQISQLNKQIREADSDHANLELRLSAREDLQRVREAALSLGMDYPKDGQVRVVALGTPAEVQGQTAANSAE